MASTRLIPVALRTAPVVMLALLVGWAMLDVSAIGDGRWSAALFTVLLTGVAAVILSAVLHGRRIRAIGPIAVGAAYVGAHAFVLGVQLMPAWSFSRFSSLRSSSEFWRSDSPLSTKRRFVRTRELESMAPSAVRSFG